MLIVSIDVGITNMGLVAAELSSEYKLSHVTVCRRVDIARCYNIDCKLSHDNFGHLSTRIRHFIDQFSEVFDRADIVLCERQPPCGLQIVQELLMYALPDLKLISPRSVHKFFGVGYLDYEGRKRAAVRLSESKLRSFPDFKEEGRRHDMADAYCILKFWIGTEGKKRREALQYQKWRKCNAHIVAGFQTFAYTGE